MIQWHDPLTDTTFYNYHSYMCILNALNAFKELYMIFLYLQNMTDETI